MGNKWRDVPGFDGVYKISIETLTGICCRVYKSGKIKILSNTPKQRENRIYWNLSYAGKTFSYQAGKWIALTFPELIENEYFEGAQIDHIDANPLNNSPSNLRWVTGKENMNNPITKQRAKERVFSTEHKKKISISNTNNPGLSKKVQKLSKQGYVLAEYPSVNQAGREENVSPRGISKACNGEKKTYKGYVWRFV